MSNANIPYGGITDPQVLRDLYQVRFHHLHDRKGRLVATIATEVIPDVVDEFGGDLVAVSAAVARKGDSPTRAKGRAIALGRLGVGNTVIMTLEQLKAEISERTILRNFEGGRGLKLRPRAPFTGSTRTPRTEVRMSQ